MRTVWGEVYTLLVQNWWSKKCRDFSFFLEHWVGLVAKKHPSFIPGVFGHLRRLDRQLGSSSEGSRWGTTPISEWEIFGRSEFVPKEMVGETKKNVMFCWYLKFGWVEILERFVLNVFWRFVLFFLGGRCSEFLVAPKMACLFFEGGNIRSKREFRVFFPAGHLWWFDSLRWCRTLPQWWVSSRAAWQGLR